MPADDLADFRASQQRIERALIGDPTLGYTGLVTRMERLEASVAEIQQQQRDAANKRLGAKWVLATIASVATVVSSGVTWLISNLKLD